MTGTAAFEELLAEGESVPVGGWDFSWFEGRASEQRPSWGYARRLRDRAARAGAVLDVQTGGGEVFAEVLDRLPRRPSVAAATEGWPPNAAVAARNLRPAGVTVVRAADQAPLPFRAGSFDLVASRHPIAVRWDEIARVLAAGGTYLAQLIGQGTQRELIEHMRGPQPASDSRSLRRVVADAETAGLTVVDSRQEALRTEFHDVAAVVVFLRKVVWTVPGFSVERYRDRLAALHDRIRSRGPFVSHAQRILIEARHVTR